MANNSFLRTLGSFAALILSILLIVLCIVAPAYFSASSLISPASVSKTIQNIDFESLINESDELDETFEKLGLDGEEVQELIQSPEVTKIIKNYSKAVTDTLYAFSTEEEFDASFLQEFAEENIDELVEVAEEIAPENVETEELKENLTNVIKSQENLFEELLPGETTTALSPVASASAENLSALRVIRYILSPAITFAVLGVVLVPIALICLLKFRKLRCLIWISVDFIICGVLLGGIFGLGNTAFFKELLPAEQTFSAQIVNSYFSTFINRIGLSALILILLAVAMLVVRSVVLKKSNKTTLAEPEIEAV